MHAIEIQRVVQEFGMKANTARNVNSNGIRLSLGGVCFAHFAPPDGGTGVEIAR